MTHPRIIRYEESIRRLSREKCCIFSSDGYVILEKDSQVDGLREICSFSDQEYQMMTRQILTHNHPSSLLFSYPDIEMAVKAQLTDLRLVTKSATFSLMPLSRIWLDANNIWESYNQIKMIGIIKSPLNKNFENKLLGKDSIILITSGMFNI